MIARAGTIVGELPWAPNAGAPPEPVIAGTWRFFSPSEAAVIEALADRIIPPDPQTPGGKDAGCAVFIDAQLAGAYGLQQGLYAQPPFAQGAKNQGPQYKDGPAMRYRAALAALDRYCRSSFAGRDVMKLSDAEKDQLLSGLENGSIKLDGAEAKDFFETLLKDVQTGFFADPVYGGNRDMVGWRMIGFPGAHYNYRDWVKRHNEKFPLPPVSIRGRSEWTRHTT
jgi:gluconate 2-dehydrogenase gamma chain